MKKMNLLSKSEMRMVTGGNEPIGICVADCQDGTTVKCEGLICTVVDYSPTTGKNGYCRAEGDNKDCE